MNNPPKDMNLEFLIGFELIQVCLGSNEIVLNFQSADLEPMSITIETCIEICLYEDGAKNDHMNKFDFEKFPSSVEFFAKFIGKKLENFSYHSIGDLKIDFSNGQLIIYNSVPDHVSYSISHKGQYYLI